MGGFNAVLARDTKSAPTGVGPYSQTVAFSHYNNLSAQLPIDPETGKLVAGGAKDQAAQCLNNIKAVLDSINHSMDDVVRLTVMLKNIADLAAVDEAVAGFWLNIYLPVRTTYAVADLPMGASVQIEALVSNGEGSIPFAWQPQNVRDALVKVDRDTDFAPKDALSTQTVAFSHYNNFTAQLPIDPKSGKLVAGGAKEQAEQCFANIKAILDSIGHVFDDIVRITIFGKSLEDIEAAKAVYKTCFSSYWPAFTPVVVAGLPKDASVQVEAVLSHGDGTPPQPIGDTVKLVKEPVNTDKAPKNDFSTQTVAFSHYNHISAQRAAGGSAAAQAEGCLQQLKAIVEAIDHSLADVVKVNIAVKNIADMAAVDEVYTKFFPRGVPARRVIGVSALADNALIQIDAVVANEEGTPPAK
jgi:reactive intermediate/imine deaminase